VRWRGKKTSEKETDQALPREAVEIQGDRAALLDEAAREEDTDGLDLAGPLAERPSNSEAKWFNHRTSYGSTTFDPRAGGM
jgi:hypothetical protein